MDKNHKSYSLVHSLSNGATSMIVLIKKELINLVTDIKFKTVPLGMMGQANKGAVSISMNF